MLTIRNIVLCLIIFLGTSIAIANEQTDAVNAIAAVKPKTWKVSTKKSGEIPFGHHWGRPYDGPKGVLVVLSGPSDVALNWKDDAGNLHEEPIAKEAIQLWIMPSSYRNNSFAFLGFKRPVQPSLIFSGKDVIIYGRTTHAINSKTDFEKILSEASSTSWPKSPATTGVVSWPSWQAAIRQSVAGL